MALALDHGGGHRSETYAVNLNVCEDGCYTAHPAEGSNLRQVLEDALGEDVVVLGNGNVSSYKGVGNTQDASWVVFRWNGMGGWSAYAGERLHNGMELVLQLSTRTVSDGGTAYDPPTLEIVKDAYFYIQIPSLEEIESVASSGARPDANSGGLTAMERFGLLLGWLERAGLDADSVEGGFWIKGTGSTANEALADAVQSCMYPGSTISKAEDRGVIEYYLDGELVHSHLVKERMYGWFVTFLGWTDTSLANGDWTYWSQFSYNPNAGALDDARQWTYNTLSLGLHDLSRYSYFALVLQTTSEMDADQGLWTRIPVPSEIPEALR